MAEQKNKKTPAKTTAKKAAETKSAKSSEKKTETKKKEPAKKKKALSEIISDYNKQYGTNHDINNFDGYYLLFP